jgi:hypothetical protein
MIVWDNAIAIILDKDAIAPDDVIVRYDRLCAFNNSRSSDFHDFV